MTALRTFCLAVALAVLAALFAAPAAQAQVAQKRFVVQSAMVNEGETAEILVLLSSKPEAAITFTVSYNFTATTGQTTLGISDFDGNPANSLTIPAGKTRGTLSYRITDDTEAEPEERLKVTVSTSASGWAPARDGADTAHVIVPPNDETSFDPDTLPETLWSATLTVATSTIGCNNETSGQHCTSRLTEDEFTLNGESYSVYALSIGSDVKATGPVIKLGRGVGESTPLLLRHYDLHVGNRVLKYVAFGTSNIPLWDATGVSWTAEESVAVSLKLPSASAPASGVVLAGDDLVSDGDGGYGLALTEGGSGSFTVALAEDPNGTLIVKLPKGSYRPPGVGSGASVAWSPDTLTFTSSNYSSPQTVTVSAPQDSDDSSEQFVILILQFDVGNTQTQYLPVGGTSKSVAGVYVTVADDEAPSNGGDSVIPESLGRELIENLYSSYSQGPGQPDDEQDSGESDSDCDGCGSDGDLGVAEPSPYAELITQMYEWRDDPQWSSHKAHTDRWDRALKAFGEDVADTSLTAMGAAEAQGFANKGWSRWVDVAAALRQIESPSPYAELITQMYEWRDDPQWSSHKAHTDRWDRALKAFGEDVADTSLTAMGAAEAQGFANKGWSRWVDVAAALREIESGG